MLIEEPVRLASVLAPSKEVRSFLPYPLEIGLAELVLSLSFFFIEKMYSSFFLMLTVSF